MKERIFVDKTEIVAGVTFGNSAQRMSWKADELQEITIMKIEEKKLFKKQMVEMISIRKKSQPMGTPIKYEKSDEKYWEGYKQQLEEFCKRNRVNFKDLTKMDLSKMPGPGGAAPQA